jgi:Protein of unknown function (DUF3631)
MAAQTITTPIEKPDPATKPQLKLDDVTTFLSRYLYCTEHQRTLLALWILHTHCFSAAEVTPYLSIQSAIEQSGKTLSLQLLGLLCPNPALTANFATNNLSSRIHYSEQRPTFLLDECHATIGSRNRSKNPILRAILSSGFHRGLGHTDRKGERVIFSPKAFAGIGPLPHALAERSIPIHLERLKPSVRLHEFRSEQAQAEAQPLRERLAEWGKENLQKLKSAPTLELHEYPAGIPLTPRFQDLLKPLLQIAKVLGREWSRRVTVALTEVFKDHLNRERKHVLALLFELREAFSHYGQPERLTTASLLVWLHHDPDASWNQEGPITASRLANLLRPFAIYPLLKYKKGEPNHRGYTLQSFLYTWNMLLPPEPAMNRNTSRREPMPDPPRSSQTNEATVRAALETAASVEHREEVSGAGVSSNSSDGTKLPLATGSGVAVVTSQKPKANGQKPSIHAGSNNLTTTREVSAAESKSAPEGSPTRTSVGGIGAQTAPSTGRPNLPGLVPNPQPIPFPSKAELEKQGYRFGPFTHKHTPVDVEMIAHYARQGYRPLQPHEVDYAEFCCNGVPFARAASVPRRPPPPEEPKPQKSPEEVAKEEMTAWLRKQQQSLPSS